MKLHEIDDNVALLNEAVEKAVKLIRHNKEKSEQHIIRRKIEYWHEELDRKRESDLY